MDTYKVATTANSTSTMHTITKKPFNMDMFSFDKDCDTYYDVKGYDIMQNLIEYLEQLRLEYNALNPLTDPTSVARKKEIWRLIIQLLPESFNQTRTWTGNYAIVRNQVAQRENHKQIEWHQYLDQVREQAPYAEELIFYKG